MSLSRSRTCISITVTRFAASMGRTAYQLGDEKKDSLLKGRARMLQSAIEFAKFEEQTEEQIAEGSAACLPPSWPANLRAKRSNVPNARRTAGSLPRLTSPSACAHARRVGRLRSRARMLEGSLPRCSSRPITIRVEELQELNRRLRGAGNVNAALSRWSRGTSARNRFRKSAKFRLDCDSQSLAPRRRARLPRVAARLSISPKKVRRILRAQRLSAKYDKSSWISAPERGTIGFKMRKSGLTLRLATSGLSSRRFPLSNPARTECSLSGGPPRATANSLRENAPMKLVKKLAIAATIVSGYVFLQLSPGKPPQRSKLRSLPPQIMWPLRRRKPPTPRIRRI